MFGMLLNIWWNCCTVDAHILGSSLHLANICNLWFICTTSDGTSPNRSFHLLHKPIDQGTDVRHRTTNLDALHGSICFISDAPHTESRLLRTVCNVLALVPAPDARGMMAIYPIHPIYQYIAQLLCKDIDNGPKLLPTLTHEQINLSLYSIMQVLISSVAKVVQALVPQKWPQPQCCVRWWTTSLPV